MDWGSPLHQSDTERRDTLLLPSIQKNQLIDIFATIDATPPHNILPCIIRARRLVVDFDRHPATTVALV